MQKLINTELVHFFTPEYEEIICTPKDMSLDIIDGCYKCNNINNYVYDYHSEFNDVNFNYYIVEIYSNYIFKVKSVYTDNDYYNDMISTINIFTDSDVINNFCGYLSNNFNIDKIKDITNTINKRNFYIHIINYFDINLNNDLEFTSKIINNLACTDTSFDNRNTFLKIVIDKLDSKNKKLFLCQYFTDNSYNIEKFKLTNSGFDILYLKEFFKRLTKDEIILITKKNFDTNSNIIYDIALDTFLEKMPTENEKYVWCKEFCVRPLSFKLNFWDKLYLFFTN